MAEAPVDVHSATVFQVELAGGVTPVLGGENWRRQKWRLTLAAMRVPRQNPSTKVAPDRKVRCVWIVAKDQTRLDSVEVTQYFLRRKVRPPVVVQTNHVQAIDRAPFIPKHYNTQLKQPCRDLVCHV